MIHHGGAGITYNCIKYKKPCLVVPHDYDQFDFAARIEYNGIGFRVSKISTARAVKKLADVLVDNRWPRLQILHDEMEKCDPGYQLKQEIYRLLCIDKLEYEFATDML